MLVANVSLALLFHKLQLLRGETGDNVQLWKTDYFSKSEK
jgi:hypothetical protein